MVAPVFGSAGPVVTKGVDLDEVFSGKNYCALTLAFTVLAVDIFDCLSLRCSTTKGFLFWVVLQVRAAASEEL